MPIRQNDRFESPEGLVGTGLWIPDQRPEAKLKLRDTLTTRLDRQDIAEILSDPTRLPARQLFPAQEWIRSQGNRGSCNGYACSWALARARKLRGLPHVPLSGEFIYARINGGRDQGSMLDDGLEAIRDVGCAPEDLVPRLEYLWRRISPEARAAAARFKGYELLGVDSEEELAAGIALGGVAVVAVQFGGRMQQLDRHGVAGAHRGPGNHSVGVDDIRIRGTRIEFDFFNSHGLRYGQQGRAWLNWDQHFAQPNRYHQFFIIRAALDDPQDDQQLPTLAA